MKCAKIETINLENIHVLLRKKTFFWQVIKRFTYSAILFIHKMIYSHYHSQRKPNIKAAPWVTYEFKDIGQA